MTPREVTMVAETDRPKRRGSGRQKPVTAVPSEELIKREGACKSSPRISPSSTQQQTRNNVVDPRGESSHTEMSRQRRRPSPGCSLRQLDPNINDNVDGVDQSQMAEHWAEFSDAWQTKVGKPGRKALHDFFYPPRQHRSDFHSEGSHIASCSMPDSNVRDEEEHRSSQSSSADCSGPREHSAPNPSGSKLEPEEQNVTPVSKRPSKEYRVAESPPEMLHSPDNDNGNDDHLFQPQSRKQSPVSPRSGEDDDDDSELLEQERQDQEYVERFWTAYDDLIILSLFTQFGILCRLGAAYFFRVFDAVFKHDSALFLNLPLNCLSCFVMGLLSSGESVMQIVSTRFTPRRLQQEIQEESHHDYDHDLEMTSNSPLTEVRRRFRHRHRSRMKVAWQRPQANLHDELREVQLLALERRIRSSPCLVLFSVNKEDADVVENYFNDGYERNPTRNHDVDVSGQHQSPQDEEFQLEGFSFDEHDLALEEEDITVEMADESEDKGKNEVGDNSSDQKDQTTTSLSDSSTNEPVTPVVRTPLQAAHGYTITPDSRTRFLNTPAISEKEAENYDLKHLEQPTLSDEEQQLPEQLGRAHAGTTPHSKAMNYSKVTGGNVVDYGNSTEHPDLDQIISNVATGVTQKISRIRRVSLADGWDVGTSPEETSEDIMLGLRIGFCGALSSFSSWISSMVNLLRSGRIGEAFVGLGIGVQLPIVAYRFGQHAAVYIFIWRCRRETRRDERRGYGIQVSMDEDSDDDFQNGSVDSLQSGNSLSPSSPRGKRTKGRRTVQEEESETPSVRAIITAMFIMSVVAQVTSLSFFNEPKDRLVALSLLFSPLGVLTRWRLSKFNEWRPNFPLGTFACNIAACALSGSLGSLLAGNPGPRERIVLVSVIAGFGGTLSSVARFIVEILNGMDPILFRLDGVYYAASSVFWGMIVSFAFAASVDWADAQE